MDFGTAIALGKVLLAFGVMLAGIRLRLGLGLAILAGAAVVGLAFGMSPAAWFRAAYEAVSDQGAVTLGLILALILLLADVMESSGQGRRLMEAVSGYIRNPRLRLVFFPALIGLLPMPGGAVFSAPVVRDVAEPWKVSRLDQSVLNYWYRHIWELCWPLYPGMILSSTLSGVPIARLMLYLSPGAACCVALGWWFFLRPSRLPLPPQAAETFSGNRDPWAILVQGLPVIVAIGGGLALEALITAAVPGLPFEWGVVAALTAAVAIGVVQNRMHPAQVLAVLTRRGFLSLIWAVAAIFMFKGVLGEAGAVEQMAGRSGGLAALFISALFLPLLVGLVSGVSTAFVGSTFPLFLSLLPRMGMQGLVPAFVVLATFAGFTGVMASPMHICFIMSCDYFGVDLAKGWRAVVVPCAVLLAFGAAYFALLTLWPA